jgi:hypothetical protein
VKRTKNRAVSFTSLHSLICQNLHRQEYISHWPFMSVPIWSNLRDRHIVVFPLLTNYRFIDSRNLLGTLPTANFRWNKSPSSICFYPLYCYSIVSKEPRITFTLSQIYREQYTARSGPNYATALEPALISKHTLEYPENKAACQLHSPYILLHCNCVSHFEVLTFMNSTISY